MAQLLVRNLETGLKVRLRKTRDNMVSQALRWSSSIRAQSLEVVTSPTDQISGGQKFGG
jgi:plasmid stability protein